MRRHEHAMPKRERGPEFHCARDESFVTVSCLPAVQSARPGRRAEPADGRARSAGERDVRPTASATIRTSVKSHHTSEFRPHETDARVERRDRNRKTD